MLINKFCYAQKLSQVHSQQEQLKKIKATVETFVASDNAFSFMSSVKRVPAYWKYFLYDVLAKG